MEKPILYYNNRLRDALSGDDGTTYATMAEVVRHPGNDNAVLCSPSLIADLAGDYTLLLGMQMKMDTTGSRYNILSQADIVSSMPAERGWHGAAWNGTIFCAVALNSGGVATDKCATSPDGITWTERTLPAARNWSSVVWNGSVFCAIAYSDKCATSPDGITWTERTMPASRQWYKIAWSGTVFCAIAVDSTDKCATSPDGITWTERTHAATQTRYDIAWNGTVFCAIAISTDKCETSSDGITWTERTMPASRSWNAIAWSGTVFCAVAIGPTDKCATSPDGITWTERTLAASTQLLSIVWNGTIFCAVGLSTDKAETSPDGITWTERTLPTSTDRYVVVYGAGIFLTLSYNVAGSDDVHISYDGIFWPTRQLTLYERFQDVDVSDGAKARAGLRCKQQNSSYPAFFAADNRLSPVHKGTENTAHYLTARMPNFLEDGGFESGAFAPNWTAEATNPWVIESTTELEGAYSASWDLVASKYLRQTGTKTLKKGMTYRLVFTAKSVTANPTAGAITVNLFQSTSGTALDSDVTGTQPAITTAAAWFAIDFTPDFTTNDWYLNIAGDSTKANGATEITMDEFYLYEKLEVNTLIIGRHNLVGKGSVKVWGIKLSPLRSTSGGDYTQLVSTTVTTSDVYSAALTSSYDPVIMLEIPATSGFTPQIGELYVGDKFQLLKFAQPTDPYEIGDDGRRMMRLSFKNIPSSYRTTQIKDICEHIAASDPLWVKWGADDPLLMISQKRGSRAPYNPTRIDVDYDLVEVL